MKRIALVAAVAALVVLTACSNSAGPAVAPGAAPVPVSCGQQYRAWEHGPGAGVVAALRTVSAASTAGNTKVLTDALQKTKPAVARGARYPVPACADPRGYWSVLLMHVNAAVASKGSASTVRAAMQGVPGIEKELTAELQATVQADAQ